MISFSHKRDLSRDKGRNDKRRSRPRHTRSKSLQLWCVVFRCLSAVLFGTWTPVLPQMRWKSAAFGQSPTGTFLPSNTGSRLRRRQS